MRTIGNVIWLILAGLWLAIAYTIAGLIACALIVTIPLGLASFRIAGYALWPFGRTVIHSPDRNAATTLGNIVWFLTAGWWLALTHLITAIGLALTIVGLPLAVANVKLVPLAFAPFGKRIVPTGTVTTTDALEVPTIG